MLLLVSGGAPGVAESAPKEPDNRIANITELTGEVMVRQQMKWKPVSKAPVPLYSGDKVVTQKGRASIKFRDGSHVDMDLDSNVKIAEKKKTTGMIFKKQVRERTVKVSLGKVWFKVNKTKGTKNTMKTPTMVAAIRGSLELVNVGLGGITQSKKIEGDIEETGIFKPFTGGFKLPNMRTPSNNLPPSNPQFSNSPLQRGAVQATQTQSLATKFPFAVNAVPRTGAPLSTIQKFANGQSDVVKGEQSQNSANGAALKEQLAEGNLFKEPETIAAANQGLNKVESTKSTLNNRLKETETAAKNAAETKDPLVALTNALIGATNANAAQTGNQAIKVQLNLVEAKSSGDGSAVKVAEKMVKVAEENNQAAQNTAKNVGKLGKLAGNATSDAGRKALLNAAKAGNNTAKAANSATQSAGKVANSANEDAGAAGKAATNVEGAAKLVKESASLSNNAAKAAGTAATSNNPKVQAAGVQATKASANSTAATGNAVKSQGKAAELTTKGASAKAIEKANAEATKATTKAGESSKQTESALKGVKAGNVDAATKANTNSQTTLKETEKAVGKPGGKPGEQPGKPGQPGGKPGEEGKPPPKAEGTPPPKPGAANAPGTPNEIVGNILAAPGVEEALAKGETEIQKTLSSDSQ